MPVWLVDVINAGDLYVPGIGLWYQAPGRDAKGFEPMLACEFLLRFSYTSASDMK